MGTEEKDIHLKGYIFDSLVYRYQLAREKALEHEISVARKMGKIATEDSLRANAKRDIMRFIEILDEAIGEHD